jgi:hypothetical protein
MLAMVKSCVCGFFFLLKHSTFDYSVQFNLSWEKLSSVAIIAIAVILVFMLINLKKKKRKEFKVYR